MSCNDFLPLMSGHIDQMNTVQEEQALQEHLASCPACRKTLAQMEQNNRLLKASVVQPPADLTDRIMKSVRTKKSRVNKTAIVSSIVSGLTVAAVMSFVFFGKTILLPAKTSSEAIQSEFLMDTAENDFVYADEAETEGNNIAYEAPAESITEAYADQGDMAAETETSVPQTSTATQDDSAIYGLPEPSAEATENTTQTGSTQKRGTHAAEEISVHSPVLIIWNADSEMISLLSAYEPEINDGTLFADVATDFPATLLSRLSSVLPFADSGDELTAEAAHWIVEVYHVPYDVMTSLFNDCVGQYEVNAYYPPELQNTDDCIVFVVRQTDGIPELPQEES